MRTLLYVCMWYSTNSSRVLSSAHCLWGVPPVLMAFLWLGDWFGYTNLPLSVHVCLWWTGVPFRGYSNFNTCVPGKDCRSTVTLTRIKQILQISKQMNECLAVITVFCCIHILVKLYKVTGIQIKKNMLWCLKSYHKPKSHASETKTNQHTFLIFHCESMHGISND